jgi:hypothetical protein
LLPPLPSSALPSTASQSAAFGLRPGFVDIERAPIHVGAAVQKWRFRPAYQDGKPVEFPTHVTVNFRLL